jgi:hypothetical protein
MTDGVSHPHPQTRSWGNWFAFVASDDLANTGNTQQQIFYFNLALFDCQQGTTLDTTPCPPPPIKFMQQATNTASLPNNPSLSVPFATNGRLIRIGSGDPHNAYVCQALQAGVPCTITHWLAFDALGNFLGETDQASTHRQIYVKNLWNQEIRRVTSGINGDSTRPVIDQLGGIVTFESTAQLLPTSPTPAGISQIFVYELKTHLLRQLTFGAGPSTAPIPDQFGADIAFQSTANLLGNNANTGVSQIFWANYDKSSHTSTLHQLTRGNGPSQHPYISEIQPFIAFDSVATNLPGTQGGSGSSVYISSPLEGKTQPPTFTQLTFPGTFGNCSYPFVDAGSVADHIGFICTGDPLQNGTIGNRVFVYERSTISLLQITGVGDVQPPIGGNLGSWFVTMSTTSPLGGATGCGYQLAFIDYLGTTQCCHAPKWIPATQIGELPPDALPPTAPGGGFTTNLIGRQNFNFIAGDPTTGQGSQLGLTTVDGTSNLPIDGSGLIPLIIGGTDEFAHQASINVSGQHVTIPPIPLADGTRLCIVPSGDGGGLIDCDGNNPGGDVHIVQHQGNADSPAVDLTGTFAAGGMRLSLPVTVNISSQPSHQGYCHAGDQYVLTTPISATLWLTTGSSETDIIDAADANGTPTGTDLSVTNTGSPFNCGALQAGTMGGAELVGGIPLLQFPQGTGIPDTILSLRLQPVPDNRTCRQACQQDSDCDDGNACNGAETCTNGFCAPGTPMVCPGDPCNGLGRCDAATGLCGHGPPCNDGNPCNGVEICTPLTGPCIAGTPIDCSAQNACTTVNGAPAYVVGTCDPSTGACGAGTPVLCDDGNPCTTDTCDPVLGCQHANNTGPCDDGNGCTTSDTCVNGVCTGVVTICDDANVCNGLESCDPTTGACIPGPPPVCEDGNPCTTDVCDAVLGCLSGNNTGPCDDGNRCTTADTCSNGACAGTAVNCSDGNVCNGMETCDPLTGLCDAGSPLSCDDGNACTTDTCDPIAGCVHTNNTSPCNDGNACTTGDVCANGVCTGTAVVCDDGNVCNGAEACNSLTGACIPGTPLNCDDGNPCTTDGCDPTTGCTHVVNGTGTVCLTGALSNAITSADPTLLGGSQQQNRLQQRIQKVQAMLTAAAATNRPKTAAKRYAAAIRGLAQFQKKVLKGIFHFNFDVTLANNLVSQAGDVVTAVKGVMAPTP